MNIGLLVTELRDRDVKKICVGAGEAARDKDVRLFIIPGGYLAGEKRDEDFLCSYQKNALFDLGCLPGLDALIIDADRIGSRSTILKKEAFLKKFEGIPVVTLSEQNGFEYVNVSDSSSLEQAGYEAVCKACQVVKGSNQDSSKARVLSSSKDDAIPALDIISDISRKLFFRKFEGNEGYRALTECAGSCGIGSFGILIYEKKVLNTVKVPFVLPEKIILREGICDGKPLFGETDDIDISLKELFGLFEKSRSKTFIVGNLFESDYQLGLIITEFSGAMTEDHFSDILVSLCAGLSRIAILENDLKKTKEELLEAQEDLARDDSVLDHIGDQDYLTGILNRRGFFAKAYDLLKESFTPGKYAIVAYIHMESLKRINEIFGHEEGDKAVKKVAVILDEVFGDSVYGRIRGNEFAVITISDEEDVAENLRNAMAEQNERLLNETGRYINRLSWAICEFDYEDTMSLKEMLKETDETLQSLRGE